MFWNYLNGFDISYNNNNTKGNDKYCLLKLTVHLPRNVKTKGMSMLNASAHVPWDLLEPLVIPSSRTLVSNVCQLCVHYHFFSIQSKAKYKCVVWFVSNANLILFGTITFILKSQKRSIKKKFNPVFVSLIQTVADLYILKKMIHP